VAVAITDQRADRWQRSARVSTAETERGTLLRHDSLPDLGNIGLVARTGSAIRLLLDFLGEPRSVDELKARFPGAPVEKVIGMLASAGLLFKADADELAFVVRGHAQSMTRMLESVGRDIQAFGPWLFDDAGSGLLPKLASLRAELADIQRELCDLRSDYIDKQMRALAVQGGRRLHLGCGRHAIAGWINIDIMPAPLRMDLDWGLPFDDGSIEYVYSAHCFEHMYYKRQARALLDEIRRVLATGGVLRLVVPDIEQCLAAYDANDHEFFETRKTHWEWAAHHRSRLDHFLAYAGAGAPLHDCMFWHKYGYDVETLSQLLSEAGFADIVRCTYMSSPHPALRVDEHAGGTAFACRGIYFDLFMEAAAPAI
jgi:predicted SAM-dependent methyltransferase